MAQKLTNWQAAREAVALGASMRHAAETYGVTYTALKTRALREQWSKPEQLAAVAPVVAAAQSWQQKGEQHRTQIFAMAQRALSAIADTPPELTNWSDIERAARLADRAAGLDAAQPVVSLTFPSLNSSEVPAFVDISTNTQPDPAP
jgi:lambda repressor-like predicted transcriptional regulator